jgi:hypothetical protein
MATAANLVEAANDSANDLNALYALGGNALRDALIQFAVTSQAQFPDQNPDGHPSANWCAIILALTSTMSGTPSIVQFQTSVQYVYRMCLMTNVLQTQSLITASQGNAVLAAYNANF